MNGANWLYKSVSRLIWKIQGLFLQQKYAAKKAKWKRWLKTQNLESFSQHRQDLFVQYYYRKSESGLFFVDIGANDGITFSNTYALEKNAKWGGVC